MTEQIQTHREQIVIKSGVGKGDEELRITMYKIKK